MPPTRSDGKPREQKKSARPLLRAAFLPPLPVITSSDDRINAPVAANEFGAIKPFSDEMRLADFRFRDSHLKWESL